MLGTTSRLLIFTGLATLLTESEARAVDLSPAAQLGRSRWANAYGDRDIWARRSDGHLARLSPLRSMVPSIGGPSGLDVGQPPGVTVGTLGVTATDVYRGDGYYDQYVYFVGSDNNLWEYDATPGVFNNLGRPNHPTKGPQNPTGYVAATTYKTGADTFVFCFLTGQDGSLYRFRRKWSSAEAPVFDAVVVDTISFTKPIAATSSGDLLHARVFATTSDNRLRGIRYSAGLPFTTNILIDPDGRPAAAIPVCGTIAAAQAQISGAVGYKINVFCTRNDIVNDRVYYATATGIASDAWTWSNTGTPGGPGPGPSLKNTSFALSANPRVKSVVPVELAIDLYALTNEASPRLFYTTRTSATVYPTMADLGADGETVNRNGGLTSTPLWPTTFSAVHFIGWQNATTPQERLYVRLGDPAWAASDPATWRNGQSADRLHGAIVQGAQSGQTEYAGGFSNGKGILAARTDPGTGGEPDFSTVTVGWTNDDGDSWTVNALANPGGFSRIVDPSADITDTGTGYVLAQGFPYVGGGCLTGNAQTARAYFYTTTDGTFPNPAAFTYLNNTIDPIDGSNWGVEHPFMAIERIAGANDVAHFVWLDWNPDYGAFMDKEHRILFQSQTGVGGALVPNPATVLAAGNDPTDPIRGNAGLPQRITGGPMLTVGAAAPAQPASVYVAWYSSEGGSSDLYVCKLLADRSGCDGPGPDGVQSLVGLAIDIPDQTSPLTQNGDLERVLNGMGFAVKASPSDPNKLYYVYVRMEGDGDGPDIESLNEDEKLVAFRVLTYVAPAWSASPEVIIGQSDLNDADDWLPSISVHANGSASDMIWVNYYTRDLNCPAGTPPPGPGTFNRCFQETRAVSYDGGASFMLGTFSDNQISDTDLLPISCNVNTKRFLGDYQEVNGDRLHTFRAYTRAPATGAMYTGDVYVRWLSNGSMQ